MTLDGIVEQYKVALRWALVVLSHPRRNSSPEAIEAEKRECAEYIKEVLTLEVKEPANGQ